MEILASQFRAARALLGKDQEDVAAWVGLDRREVSRWEAAKYKLFSSDAEDLQKAFEKNGIEFLPATGALGAGVRWRKPGQKDRFRGAQFRAARAMANQSMRDLQEMSGVNRNFVTRLETAQIGGLNLETLKKLERAFARLHIELTPESETWGAGVRWTVPDPFSQPPTKEHS
ncbi:helix-turn-helix domain-containing protein [Rhizobium etli bv. phaseoli str. IE4803]|uniref:Helix-turn-helix domain-containing protein n=1 Tax=Rhizobium etli bv. mimosae str. IE4771 TaxID=1432050 RepID=A0A060I2Y2_RHIET|nr:helix-turn-helix domain-containing protein [Rhizobium sp. IE4771]AIC28064.1 helix-turn-helix domain-containing protein [Rhizobium sp. IE4771]AJC80123.1 helix-turn-helix domain-containing protein [Rhizobium etli bv. phaseoli str. IE4803]